jgi:hypothetical protein
MAERPDLIVGAALGVGDETGVGMAESGLLNLDQFDSVEDAYEKVEPGGIYLEAGREVRETGLSFDFTIAAAFWFSMLARSQGLHSAIAREIRANNPHAVFPLIRAFTETVVILMYVVDHPDYISVLTSRARELPKDGPKRKSMQALISYASRQAPGLKAVYAELSEATHVGAIAIWASHSIDEREDGSARLSWTSDPRWRSNKQLFIACAQTLELAATATTLLHNFAGRHVLKLAE